jgi:hypothetical protein
MYSFNSTAVLVGALTIVGILGLMLLLSPHDTLAELRNLFDPRPLRTVVAGARRFSVRQLLVAIGYFALVCVGLAYVVREWGVDSLVDLAVIGAYFLVIVLPIFIYVVSDAFAPSSRDRWRELLKRSNRVTHGEADPPPLTSEPREEK